MKISLQKIISSVIIIIIFISPALVMAEEAANDGSVLPPKDAIQNSNAPLIIPTAAPTVATPPGYPNTYTYNGVTYQNGTGPAYSSQYQGATGINPYGANNPNLNQAYVNSQIQNTITTSTTTGSTAQTSSYTKTAVSAAGCGAGQILSNIVTSSVSSSLGKTASGAADSILNVPVKESGIVGENIQTQTAAKVGGVVGLGGISTLAAPSWDAVAYCIVNAMIIYIADSTIQWINTGFEGNPAFLNNPEDFFKQLADEEAAGFVQNLAYGVTGVNVCDVFRSAMVSSILNQYNQQNGYGYGYQMGGYNKGLSNGFLGCTFDQNPAMLNSFVQGNFIQGGGWNSWYNMTQNPYSNPYDTYYNTNDRLHAQVLTTQANQNQQLGWNNGFLNYKKCTDPKDPKTCTIVTPGSVIQNQLNETLNLGKNRLVLADKFDQVVTALINQLVVTALGKALETTQQTGY